MAKLANLLRFVELLNRYRAVKREIFANSEDRLENDVEHSYQLTMLAWYIVEAERLSLDKNLLLKYALVHDLVEAYAGDTFAFADENKRQEKVEQEKKALGRLRREFAEFKELTELIGEYEERKNPESRFIYALDKLQPTLNIYLDGGRSWRRDGVTLQMILNYKNDLIAKVPELKQYFDELIFLIKQNEKALFNP
ncbi:MAG TPA: HD domain-containing protein [Candidatus Paceibacterota bacterium]